jgi:hypothetical protein
MSYVEKKFLGEGQNETTNQIDLFKNRTTGELVYRDGNGQEILVSPQEGIRDLVECHNADAYSTPVYDIFPYIAKPTMVKSCTTIDSTSVETLNMETYKIGGIVYIPNTKSVGVIYLGSVDATTVNGSPFSVQGPWKISGSVDAYDGSLDMSVGSSLASGAFLTDTDSGETVATDMLTIMASYYTPGAFDLYLVYAATSVKQVEGVVSFEYEFLVNKDSIVNFNFYLLS